MRATRGLTNGLLIVVCFGFGVGSGILIVCAVLMHRYTIAVTLSGYPALLYAVYQQRGLIERLRATIVKSTERAYQHGLEGRRARQ